MNISRQTYYKYKNKQDYDYIDYLLIKEVFEKGGKIYGYRRLKKHILSEYGWIINHKKLLRIMKKYNLRVKYQNVFKRNYSRIKEEKYSVDDLIQRNFKAKKENEKWCTDVTYLIHNGKKAYLSTILDLKDSKIVAHKISKSKLKPWGFNYLCNENKIAGQEVMHVHMHVIPKYGKDEGFKFGKCKNIFVNDIDKTYNIIKSTKI